MLQHFWQLCSAYTSGHSGSFHVLALPIPADVWCDTSTVQVRSSFCVELQNASLTVLSDGSTQSLTSSESLWGQEMTDPATGYQCHRRSSHGLSPHEASLETWLMLEYCDKGSLLVGTPPPPPPPLPPCDFPLQVWLLLKYCDKASSFTSDVPAVP